MQTQERKEFELSGKVEWVDFSETHGRTCSLEPACGFFIASEGMEGICGKNKDDLIINKLWDVLYSNLGKDIRIIVERRVDP